MYFNYYGDVKCAAISDLRKPEYYKKSTIEGDNRKFLRAAIEEYGVKRPIVINMYSKREGVIIDGVEVYNISKELGIYDVPVYDLSLTYEKEKELHYDMSIRCNEYSFDEIVKYLKTLSYNSYFPELIQTDVHKEIFDLGERELQNNKRELLSRKQSFILRYDSKYAGYLEKLKQIFGVKSQNEALMKVIIDIVEGRVVL